MSKILICVASESRWVTVDLAMFLAKAVSLSADPDYPYQFSIDTIVGVRGFASMRNQGVKKFFASDADRLWFVDDDLIPNERVFQLPKVEGDIVCAPYPWHGSFKVHLPVYKDLWDLEKGMADNIPPSPQPYVDCVPMGCTLIDRRVLEDRRMWLGYHWVGLDHRTRRLKDGDSPPLFQETKKANGDMEHGDDHDFCIRARQLGYTVRADMTMVCGHYKTVDLVEAVPMVLEGYAVRRGVA